MHKTYFVCGLILLSNMVAAQRFSDDGICNGSEKYPQSWKYVGHKTDVTSEGSMGRTNMVYVDQKNDSSLNTVYLGTDYSGLWKSENFQNDSPNWKCITCQSRLPGLGVVDMDINPQNPNEMLLATGIGANFLLEYGLGVVKSTDGGKTWKTTSLSFDTRGNMTSAFRVKYKPNEPQIVLAHSRNELYRSTNGGENFELVYEIKKKNKSYRRPFLNDLLFDLTNPNWVYATSENGEVTALQDGGGRLIISQNGGETWNDITQELPEACNDAGNTRFDRVEISLSPSAINRLVVYAVGSGGLSKLYICNNIKSENRKWRHYNTTGGSGSWWMADLQCSLIDSSIINYAHVELQQMDLRTIKNQRLTCTRPNYNLHVDLRDLDAGTNSKGKEFLFVAHDGGVAMGKRLKNDAFKWYNKNGKGLEITQYFGIASFEERGYLGGGAQDLGSIYTTNHKWKRLHIGDGYDCETDVLGNSIYVGNNVALTQYVLNQKNELVRSTSKFAIGRDQTSVVDAHGTIYYAAYASGNGGYSGDQTMRDEYDEDKDGKTGEYIKGNFILYKTQNGEVTFVANRPAEIDKSGHRISAIAINESNPNIIYVGTDKKQTNRVDRLYRIENPQSQNAKWIDLSAKLLLPEKDSPKARGQGVSDIAVDLENANAIWVAYKDNIAEGRMKVIYHPDVTDSTKDWVYIDLGLGRFPINKLEIDPKTGYLYAATDVGIYVNTNPKNASSTWECYNRELPVVKVTDLEIDPCSGYLYASTFGRGIWKNSLVKSDSVKSTILYNNDTIKGNYRSSKNLELNAKTQLVIQGNLILANDCKIILQPGSKLKVIGQILAPCSKQEVQIEMKKGNLWQRIFWKEGELIQLKN